MAKDPCEALELQLKQAEKEQQRLEKRALDLKAAAQEPRAKGALADMTEGDPAKAALRVLHAEQDPLSLGSDTVPALSGRRAVKIYEVDMKAGHEVPVVGDPDVVVFRSVNLKDIVRVVEEAEKLGLDIDPGALAVRDKVVEMKVPVKNQTSSNTIRARVKADDDYIPHSKGVEGGRTGEMDVYLQVGRTSPLPVPMKGKGYGYGLYMSLIQRAKNMKVGVQSGNPGSVSEEAQAVWNTIRDILGEDVVVKRDVHSEAGLYRISPEAVQGIEVKLLEVKGRMRAAAKKRFKLEQELKKAQAEATPESIRDVAPRTRQIAEKGERHLDEIVKELNTARQELAWLELQSSEMAKSAYISDLSEPLQLATRKVQRLRMELSDSLGRAKKGKPETERFAKGEKDTPEGERSPNEIRRELQEAEEELARLEAEAAKAKKKVDPEEETAPPPPEETPAVVETTGKPPPGGGAPPGGGGTQRQRAPSGGGTQTRTVPPRNQRQPQNIFTGQDDNLPLSAREAARQAKNPPPGHSAQVEGYVNTVYGDDAGPPPALFGVHSGRGATDGTWTHWQLAAGGHTMIQVSDDAGETHYYLEEAGPREHELQWAEQFPNVFSKVSGDPGGLYESLLEFRPDYLNRPQSRGSTIDGKVSGTRSYPGGFNFGASPGGIHVSQTDPSGYTTGNSQFLRSSMSDTAGFWNLITSGTALGDEVMQEYELWLQDKSHGRTPGSGPGGRVRDKMDVSFAVGPGQPTPRLTPRAEAFLKFASNLPAGEIYHVINSKRTPYGEGAPAYTEPQVAYFKNAVAFATPAELETYIGSGAYRHASAIDTEEIARDWNWPVWKWGNAETYESRAGMQPVYNLELEEDRRRLLDEVLAAAASPGKYAQLMQQGEAAAAKAERLGKTPINPLYEPLVQAGISIPPYMTAKNTGQPAQYYNAEENVQGRMRRVKKWRDPVTEQYGRREMAPGRHAMVGAPMAYFPAMYGLAWAFQTHRADVGQSVQSTPVPFETSGQRGIMGEVRFWRTIALEGVMKWSRQNRMGKEAPAGTPPPMGGVQLTPEEEAAEQAARDDSPDWRERVARAKETLAKQKEAEQKASAERATKKARRDEDIATAQATVDAAQQQYDSLEVWQQATEEGRSLKQRVWQAEQALAKKSKEAPAVQLEVPLTYGMKDREIAAIRMILQKERDVVLAKIALAKEGRMEGYEGELERLQAVLDEIEEERLAFREENLRRRQEAFGKEQELRERRAALTEAERQQELIERYNLPIEDPQALVQQASQLFFKELTPDDKLLLQIEMKESFDAIDEKIGQLADLERELATDLSESDRRQKNTVKRVYRERLKEELPKLLSLARRAGLDVEAIPEPFTVVGEEDMEMAIQGVAMMLQLTGETPELRRTNVQQAADEAVAATAEVVEEEVAPAPAEEPAEEAPAEEAAPEEAAVEEAAPAEEAAVEEAAPEEEGITLDDEPEVAPTSAEAIKARLEKLRKERAAEEENLKGDDEPGAAGPPEAGFPSSEKRASMERLAELQREEDNLLAQLASLEQGKGSIAEILSKERPVENIPIADIKIDPRRFQFKKDIDVERGIKPEDELVSSSWAATPAKSVILWRDAEGQLWMVEGHHRYDLVKNRLSQLPKSDPNYKDSLPSQIFDHTELTIERAKALGAYANILDEKGSTRDYIFVLDENLLLPEEVSELLRADNLYTKDGNIKANLNQKAKALLIGVTGQAELRSAFLNGGVSEKDATHIAIGSLSAPGNEREAQMLGIDMATKEDTHGDLLESMVSAMGVVAQRGKGKAEFTQGDIFGLDTAFIEETKAVGKARADILSEFGEILSAYRGGKSAASAERLMELTRVDPDDPDSESLITVADPEATAAVYTEIKTQRDRLKRKEWGLDGDLVRMVEKRAGIERAPETEIAAEEADVVVAPVQPSFVAEPEEAAQPSFVDMGDETQGGLPDTEPVGNKNFVGVLYNNGGSSLHFFDTPEESAAFKDAAQRNEILPRPGPGVSSVESVVGGSTSSGNTVGGVKSLISKKPGWSQPFAMAESVEVPVAVAKADPEDEVVAHVYGVPGPEYDADVAALKKELAAEEAVAEPSPLQAIQEAVDTKVGEPFITAEEVFSSDLWKNAVYSKDSFGPEEGEAFVDQLHSRAALSNDDAEDSAKSAEALISSKTAGELRAAPGPSIESMGRHKNFLSNIKRRIEQGFMEAGDAAVAAVEDPIVPVADSPATGVEPMKSAAGTPLNTAEEVMSEIQALKDDIGETNRRIGIDMASESDLAPLYEEAKVVQDRMREFDPDYKDDPLLAPAAYEPIVPVEQIEAWRKRMNRANTKKEGALDPENQLETIVALTKVKNKSKHWPEDGDKTKAMLATGEFPVKAVADALQALVEGAELINATAQAAPGSLTEATLERMREQMMLLKEKREADPLRLGRGAAIDIQRIGGASIILRDWLASQEEATAVGAGATEQAGEATVEERAALGIEPKAAGERKVKGEKAVSRQELKKKVVRKMTKKKPVQVEEEVVDAIEEAPPVEEVADDLDDLNFDIDMPC